MSEPVPTAVVHGKLPPHTSPAHPAGAPGSELPAGVMLVPTYRLYSAGQVGLATFLGGPPGGAWLLARNCKRLGQPGRGRLTFSLAVVVTAVLLGVAIVFPAVAPRFVSVTLVFAMVGLARSMQGEALVNHQVRGGRKASSWWAVATGLISLASIGALLLGGVVAFTLLDTKPSVDLGHGHLISYSEGATEAEARALGGALAELGFFADDQPASVAVEHVAGHHVVSLVVRDFVLTNDASQVAIHKLVDKLSATAFAGEPVDVRLTDGYLAVKVVLLWDNRPRHLELTGGTLWYLRGASEREGRAVGEILRQENYSGDVEVRRDGRAVVAFYVQDGVWDQDSSRQEFHGFATLLAPAFGGAPVDIWLLTSAGAAMTKLRWEDRPR